MIKTAAVMGIDPGGTGAACFFPLDQKGISFVDYPSSGNLVDLYTDLSEFKLKHTVELAVLEKVGPMPREGVRSVFTFGQNVGAWKMFLVIHGIPFVEVTPQRWQKGIYTKDDVPKTIRDPKRARKEAIFSMAERRFPNAELRGPKGGKKFGRADALFLAFHAFMEAGGRA